MTRGLKLLEWLAQIAGSHFVRTNKHQTHLREGKYYKQKLILTIILKVDKHVLLKLLSSVGYLLVGISDVNCNPSGWLKD